MADLAPDLDVKLVDQDELESSLIKKANRALLSKESELDEKRLHKTTQELAKVRKKITALESRLNNPRTRISSRRTLRDEVAWFTENELQPLLQDVKDIQSRLESNRVQLQGGESRAAAGESERDFLIRTGKITAFGNSSGFSAANVPQSSVHLRAPGFQSVAGTEAETNEEKEDLSEDEAMHTAGLVEVDSGPERQDDSDGSRAPETHTRKRARRAHSPQSDENHSDASFHDISESDADDYDQPRRKTAKTAKTAESAESTESPLDFSPEPETASDPEPVFAQRNLDDGDEEHYQKRLHEWVRQRSQLRAQNVAKTAETVEIAEGTPEKPEWQLPHPTIPDAVLNDRFSLPGDVFPSLFDYQKTCVQWLWELYSQKTGGIIGDEMGLGKTVQVIAFLAGLHHSNLLDKPVLLVVPATVLNQWVNEFHRWWPPLRCVILHSIGSGMARTVKAEEQLEREMEQDSAGSEQALSAKMASNQINAREIVERVVARGHVLVTTYVGLRIYSKQILRHSWGYVVLDEGHKIRNPNSEISLACKRVKTHNRVILSGTPIQNNLTELWSLFDFVFPGRLGTLPVFEQQFAIPINMGGYANASNVQVQTGYQCAVVLRDLISPYLLRRLKADVAQDLPKKNEMVLFVKLTQYQQNMYEQFLGSEDVGAILKGRRNVLMGVDMLRKICNHPDLVDRELLQKRRKYNYGETSKSGKMVVLRNLLQLWQSQGHRTLLFCQTKQMLDILEKFVANLGRRGVVEKHGLEDESGDGLEGPTDRSKEGSSVSEGEPNADPNDHAADSKDSLSHTPSHIPQPFNYLRMDGSTPIARRQQLVDTFNSNEHYHVFLLTTKVGGLGVNLTGADRVIIFDPDWNPSTDLQARERAWRLGQKKDITIYRLMTAGTIEEKIYHRQIFKTFLTNKILKDPKQRRFFKLNDLHDLFSLGDPDERGTETGEMFRGSEQTYAGDKERKSTRLSKQHRNDDDFYQVASIMGVSKLDQFEGDENDKDDSNKDPDEGRIMEGIFANAGVVHSTLRHDEIVDSSHQEVSLVEREASRVAKEAADALKKSRLLARKTAIGTPTWTGKFGTAGRFGTQKKSLFKKNASPSDPLSSSSILKNLREGKGGENGAGNPQKPTAAKKDDRAALLKLLVEYLSAQEDHFSKSNAILRALPKSVDTGNESEMVVVRSLLREAAEWKPEQKGWKLKASFETGD